MNPTGKNGSDFSICWDCKNSTKPHICPFTLWLDPNTRTQAIGFVIPDPAYETGLESVPGSAGDIQSVIDKFI